MEEVARLYWQATARMHDREGEAVLLLDRALEIDPDHAPSLLLRAILAGRADDRERCGACLSRVVRVGTPKEVETAGARLAAALRRWDRLDEADAVYRDLLARRPDAAALWVEWALLLRERGETARAATAIDRAVSCQPDFVPALVVKGELLLDGGNLAAAETTAMEAHALAPLDPEVVRGLAAVRLAQGRAAEVVALCRQVPAARPSPDLLLLQGRALIERSDPDAAAACFEQAMAEAPGRIDARYNLATVRKEQGRTDEAVSLLRDVVRMAPAFAPARLALCMAVLPPLYRDEAEVGRRREDYAAGLDALARFADGHGPALADAWGVAQPFLLAYQGENDLELQRRYGELGCRAMANRWPAMPLARPPASGERLRVGFVSGHFRNHSVWRLPTRGWVEGLDPKRFELIGFHTGAIRDEETARAARLFARFHQGPYRVERWRDLISTERVHALIFPEIGMDPMVAKLAAMRLAPTQYASWGHPSTSGYPTIDFFLSSDAMEPPDGMNHYSERLVRLPGLSTPLAVRPMRSFTHGPKLPETDPNAVLFWCGQNLSKYLPRHDDLWVRIALACPRARFLFVAHPGSAAVTERFRSRLATAFGLEGLSADRHCRILPPLTPAGYAEAMGSADIVLDSVGWSGCNTLVEALAAGRPTLTLPGEPMRARHGAALLGTLSLADQICSTEAAYVATAIRLANDANLRHRIAEATWAALPRLNDGRGVEGLAAHLVRHAGR